MIAEPSQPWPFVGGELALLIRDHEWARTPLGPLDGWSERLKMAVETMLASPLVSGLVCGPERILIYNDAAARLYGDKHPEALGRPLPESFPVGWRSVEPLYTRVFAGEVVQAVAQPVELRGGDAAEGVFDAWLTPIRDERGAVAYAQMIGVEVGARRAAEAALRDSEARLRALVTASAASIYRMSPDWRFMHQLESSDFLAPTGEPTGDWIDRYIPPADRPMVSAAIEAAVRDRSMFDLEHRVRLADGGVGWVSSRAVPMLGPDGEIVEWFGAGSDVTERRLAQEKLRESEERYRSLFDSMDQGFCTIRLVFDEQGRPADYEFLAMNPAFERQTGLSGAAGRRMRDFAPNLESFWFETYGRVARTGEPERFEHEAAALGRWFAVNAFALNGEHKDGVAVLFEDITARKQAASALRESEERQVFLLALSDKLRPLSDPVEIMAVASEALGRHLGVGRCGYGEVDETGEFFIVARDWTDGVMPSFKGRHLFVGFGPEFLEGYRAGRSVLIDDAFADARATGSEAAFVAAGGVRASLGLPLIKDGEFVAGLFVQQLPPRKWTAKDESLAQEVAERTWASVERARAEAARRASEERLRQFGEASQDILWIRDAASLQWVYLTPAFETIYGLSRDEALTGDNYRRWQDLIVPEDRDHALASIARVRAGEWVTFEFRIRRPSDGAIRWLRNTDFPIVDDEGRNALIGGIGHDFTEVRDAEVQLRTLMEGIPQLVWRADGDGEWTWASPQWTAFTGQTSEDSQGWGWLDALHPDDREQARSAWRHAIKSEGFETEHRLRDQHDGSYRWFRTRASPVRNEAGVITNWLGTSTDVHDLRALQDRQRVLLHELQHRVRNTLAVVRSIASSTGETSETVEDFASHFEGRLSALARTQMVLTRSPGEGVNLEDMVREELLAQAAQEPQIDVGGPEVSLSPKAAEVLTLSIHELATNAVKYGALSAPAGRISVRWETFVRFGQESVRLVWEESGVRVAATAPRREGFGTELIESRVPYELRGSGVLHFRPGGVRCVIEFPLAPGESILQTSAPVLDVLGGRATEWI